MNATLRPIKTKAELGLAEQFAAAGPTLPGGPAISKLRTVAFDRFAAAGLPHSRVEAWKYTDLRRLMADAKPLACAPDAAARAGAAGTGSLFTGLGFRRLVIVDGSFIPELSDLADVESGLTIQTMASAFARDDFVQAQRLSPAADGGVAVSLNAALAADGVAIEIAPGTKVERPIHLAFVTTTESAAFVKSLVVIGDSARATLVESHEGPDGCGYQVNSLLELLVGDRSVVEHIKVIQEGDAALHVGTLLATVGAQAVVRKFGLVTGGAVVRNELTLRLAGEGATVAAHGASLLAGRQHADTTLLVDHQAPHGESREIFKAVIDDEARAVFQGKITVQPGAQKTDGKMMARGLLLSDTAEFDCKPELEIFADDVQCGHGSTTGALDGELKFYLQARGIPEKQAEALLIHAFVGEVFETVAHDGSRDALLAAMTAWLDGRG
ncbi:Fe-S cluster assembly protein SufD [Bradyrhizobium sp.]|uniref:Fe-S cluster assembly protein SufD n=1 Tax=Bradyrhizobium sp. TaxID=376 RepID=UPI002D6B64DA|nr:Fe-S cluster assembly protein SufD [Bradyrhizobium sp.]HZR73798.1 Fe-S cluster assembly protein SufD [Bradyrhizobium sp.]